MRANVARLPRRNVGSRRLSLNRGRVKAENDYKGVAIGHPYAKFA